MIFLIFNFFHFGDLHLVCLQFLFYGCSFTPFPLFFFVCDSHHSNRATVTPRTNSCKRNKRQKRTKKKNAGLAGHTRTKFELWIFFFPSSRFSVLFVRIQTTVTDVKGGEKGGRLSESGLLPDSDSFVWGRGGFPQSSMFCFFFLSFFFPNPHYSVNPALS